MPRDAALVPESKFDLAAAARARAAGWPAVEGVLGDLVGWCLDSNWPVAKELGPFLGRLGLPVVPHVREVLAGGDASAKYHLLVCVVEDMEPSARAELRAPLTRLATAPTAQEVADYVPEIASRLLAENGDG